MLIHEKIHPKETSNALMCIPAWYDHVYVVNCEIIFTEMDKRDEFFHVDIL